MAGERVGRGARALRVLCCVVLCATVGCRARPSEAPEDLSSADWKLRAAHEAIRDQRFEDAEALLTQAEHQAPGIDAKGLLPKVRAVISTARRTQVPRSRK